ncbi:MAG: response regulator [Geothermobacteraceae bacterium]
MNDKRIRVLIIDDDLRISRLHQKFVEKVDGFEVVGVANQLEDAREMLEILEPDLVLLDLFFPEGNGMDLLRHIRSGAKPCDVILITAAREAALFQEGLRGGVFDYIIKPVFFPRFQEALVKYRDYLAKLELGAPLEQQDVDRMLRSPAPRTLTPGERAMPKGIDELTLTKVRSVFANPDTGDLNAEHVAAEVGVSRSTARRYLEFLVSEGFLMADQIYGAVGRPERRYRRS